MFGDPRFSFDRSLSLSIAYRLWKIVENLLWKFYFFFNFSANASSNSAIILAAQCWQKPILKVGFNWKDDIGLSYLLDRLT